MMDPHSLGREAPVCPVLKMFPKKQSSVSNFLIHIQEKQVGTFIYVAAVALVVVGVAWFLTDRCDYFI